jgi:hypothetical protein
MGRMLEKEFDNYSDALAFKYHKERNYYTDLKLTPDGDRWVVVWWEGDGFAGRLS